MGYYINPNVDTKEAFLQNKGTLVENVKWEDVDQKLIPVCLVANPTFSAAAICYDKEELEYFQQDDGRNKKWYLVPKNAVMFAVDDWTKDFLSKLWKTDNERRWCVDF